MFGDKKFAVAMAVAVGLGVAAGGAFAADATGQAAATKRHDNFKAQGAAFKGLLDEIKKETPDKVVIATNAAKLKASSLVLQSWFVKGSGPDAGVKTEAKAEAFTDAAGFAAAADKFKTEAAKLDALAQAGDIDGVKGQVRAVGGACKGCHDKYRAPEKKG
ncbi:MAG: cytochrome [Phenylobacterium sp.]|jgi:cytochrome c556|nr:cytochrome [Phenylobacterium sp.]